MSLTRLASLALTLTLLSACAGNQGGGQGPDPEPNRSGAPDAPDAPGARPAEPDEPAARPKRPSKKTSELEVRIQAPRDGASFGKAPVEVVVEVTHRGELRSLTLEGADVGQAEALAREELDSGKPGGQAGSGGASGGAVEDGDVTFSQTAPGGSDADKTIARAKVAKKVIERILGEWSFSALRGERRREVVTQAIATLRRERFKAYRGKYRYTATVNMPEARNLVLDAFAVERTFGAEPYLLVAEGASWFKGAKLSRDEVAAVRAGLTASSADWLNRWRFKQAGTGKLQDGALLQRGPLRESTYQGLGATYSAGLVLVIKGGVAYEPFKGSNHATEAGFQGYLRTRGLICVVYDRTREQIAAQFTVKSSADKRSEDEATTDSAHQPWVAKDASVSEEAERYAQFLGRLVASNVMRRLCADYYANLPPAPMGALSCPGCGDLCPPGTQRCPACDSPLGPSGGAGATPPATGPSLYRSRYRWLIKDPKVGKNKLRVVAVDSAGRTAADRCTFSFTPPDTEPPLVKIVKPAKGEVFSEKPIEVLIEVSDARGLTSVTANGKSLPGARGQRQFTYRFKYQPSEGGNDIELEARDAAGNRGRAHTSFTYRRPDTTPPVLTLLAPKSGASLTSAPIVIAVNAEDAGGVSWVKINGVAASQDSKGRWRVQIKTPREGKNAIQVEASDAAGNRATLSSQFLFDSTPPEVEASASLTVKGVMKDLGGTLTINGQKVEFDRETGAYEAKVKPHPDHPDKVIIVATDELGNRSERIEKVR